MWAPSDVVLMAVGDIGVDVIDVLSLDACPTGITHSGVTHATGDWFVVIEDDPGTANVILHSFSVDNAGNIGACPQDSQTIGTDGAGVCDIVKISDGIIATIRKTTSATAGPIIETWVVDSSGNIAACPTDTFDTGTGGVGSAVGARMDPTKHNNIYAIFRREGVSTWRISTIDIDSSGNIAAALADSVTIGNLETVIDTTPRTVWTGQGDYHAVCYQKGGGDGEVATFTIDSCGNIGCIADTFVFEACGCDINPSIGSNDAGILILQYEGACTGIIKTLNVDGCGQITSGNSLTTTTVVGGSLLRIDELGDKNIFLAVKGSHLSTWSFDTCAALTAVDTLVDPEELLENRTDIVFHPASSIIVVGSGFNSGACANFGVWSVDVETNITAKKGLGGNGAAKLQGVGII